MTAQLVGPDGVAHVLEAGVAHQPGTYPFTYSAFDAEGTWHWKVTATDDLGRVSTIDRPFRYDTTLRALAAAAAQGSATIRFALGRAADGPAPDRDDARGDGARCFRRSDSAVGRSGSPGTAGSQAVRVRRAGRTSRTSSRRATVGTSDLAAPFAFSASRVAR